MSLQAGQIARFKGEYTAASGLDRGSRAGVLGERGRPSVSEAACARRARSRRARPGAGRSSGASRAPCRASRGAREGPRGVRSAAALRTAAAPDFAIASRASASSVGPPSRGGHRRRRRTRGRVRILGLVSHRLRSLSEQARQVRERVEDGVGRIAERAASSAPELSRCARARPACRTSGRPPRPTRDRRRRRRPPAARRRSRASASAKNSGEGFPTSEAARPDAYSSAATIAPTSSIQPSAPRQTRLRASATSSAPDIRRRARLSRANVRASPMSPRTTASGVLVGVETREVFQQRRVHEKVAPPHALAQEPRARRPRRGEDPFRIDREPHVGELPRDDRAGPARRVRHEPVRHAAGLGFAQRLGRAGDQPLALVDGPLEIDQQRADAGERPRHAGAVMRS